MLGPRLPWAHAAHACGRPCGRGPANGLPIQGQAGWQAVAVAQTGNCAISSTAQLVAGILASLECSRPRPCRRSTHLALSGAAVERKSRSAAARVWSGAVGNQRVRVYTRSGRAETSLRFMSQSCQLILSRECRYGRECPRLLEYCLMQRTRTNTPIAVVHTVYCTYRGASPASRGLPLLAEPATQPRRPPSVGGACLCLSCGRHRGPGLEA